MAMNKFMHPRNIYSTPADFAKLSEEFDEFRSIAKTTEKGKTFIDFKDETALKTLTTCLLKRDFNLTVHLPPKQLVPTLPLRLNYVLWIEDIVNTFKFENVIGLDIGCGASCIYPLLVAQSNPEWKMFAIELNEESVNYARENVQRNGLSDRVHIIDCASKDDPLAALDESKEWQRFDFTMCNPPFFKDETESNETDATSKQHSNKRQPNNAKTGISCELLTAGGEIEFVKKIIERSSLLRSVINVFTTMLGHKTSVQPVLQALKTHGITNHCTSEFCQGWTKRWGIAWSFRNNLPLRLVPVIGQTQPKPSQRFLPHDIDDADIAVKKLCQILSELNGSRIVNREKIELGERLEFVAVENSWKNQRRKRREQARAQQNVENNEEHETDSIPAKRIRLEQLQDIDRVTETLNSCDAPLLLHIELSVQSKTVSELKAIVEIKLTYLNGSMGPNGVYELLQYIQNKWTQ